MTGDGEARLTLCEVHCNGQRRIIVKSPADRIRHHLSTVGHRKAGVPAEGHRCQRTAIDSRGSNRSVPGASDADGGDIKVIDAKDIAEPEAE